MGEGGFSIELLRAADEWVLRAFYRALLKDISPIALCLAIGRSCCTRC